MGILSKLAKSTDLVNGMADRLGADLSDTIMSNPEIEGPKYRNMVLKCTQCSDPDACAALLEQNKHLDEAPDYCQNKQVLDSKRTD